MKITFSGEGLSENLFEVVQEDRNAFQCFLRLVLNFDGKLDLSFGHSAQIRQSL